MTPEQLAAVSFGIVFVKFAIDLQKRRCRCLTAQSIQASALVLSMLCAAVIHQYLDGQWWLEVAAIFTGAVTAHSVTKKRD